MRSSLDWVLERFFVKTMRVSLLPVFARHFVSFFLAALLCVTGFWGAASADTVPSTRNQGPQEPRILAIGDSMMSWHLVSRNAISNAVSDALGEPVENRAVGGARMQYALPITGAMGLNISKQYRDDPVDWVVLNGGGNDLWLGCGCKACDTKVNRMVSKNGNRGTIPQLVDRILARGANVIYLGYLRSPGIYSAIDACADYADEFEGRIAEMVSKREGAYFLDLSELVPYGDASYHGVDLIHPSRKGSQVIGQKVADVIRMADDAR